MQGRGPEEMICSLPAVSQVIRLSINLKGPYPNKEGRRGEEERRGEERQGDKGRYGYWTGGGEEEQRARERARERERDREKGGERA